MLRKLSITIIFLTMILILFQLSLGIIAEKYAYNIGKMDDTARELNIVYLDLEEKIALFRSQSFLVAKYKDQYKPHPKKVIYIEPIYDETVAAHSPQQ